MRPEGPPDWPPDDPAVGRALQDAIAGRIWGHYHGPTTDELKARLGEYHGRRHVQLCASGTVAIELALRGLRVTAGDEVILAAYDFKGNFQNVLAVGATPVLADVNRENSNLDPERLEEAIRPATKAIVVSHLHGGIVPMPEVMQIARSHSVTVIEDACQMPGAFVYGRKAGTWGDVAVLSFGGSKLLCAGRGGSLMTDDDGVVQRVKLYSHRGNEAYPLSELQAAVLIPQLAGLDAANRIRSDAVVRLCGLLAHQSAMVPFRNAESDSRPGYYKLGFQYNPGAMDGLPRNTFLSAMQAEGIALHSGFRALHAIHGRRRFKATGELANATTADACVLTLHHPVLLGSDDDLTQIVAALDKISRHAAQLRDQMPERGRRTPPGGMIAGQ